MAILLLNKSDVTEPKDNLVVKYTVKKFKDLENIDPIVNGCVLVEKEHLKYSYIAIWEEDKKRWLAFPKEYEGKKYIYPELIELNRVYSIENINKLVDNDDLTGLLKKNKCMELFDNELDRSLRENLLCSVVLLDLDNFKQVNDMFGYDSGDHVLKECSDAIKGISRPYDILCRWGGDEFFLIYPNTDRVEVVLIGERLRDQMSKIEYRKNDEYISMSASMSMMTIDSVNTSISARFAFKYVDHLLKKSKMVGKNCVVISQQLDKRLFDKYKELLI